MDELVEGYSQFTALADEASKGVAVGGVRDPLGRSASLPSTSPSVPAAPGGAQSGAPSARSGDAFGGSAPARGGFSGGGNAAAGPSPVFAAASGGAVDRAARGRADPIQDPVARDALKLLFSKEGNYVQVRFL